MRPTLTTLVAAAIVATGLGTSGAHANTLFTISDLRAATPSCSAFPSAPVKGYVSGEFSDISRGASFVGCFPSLASCEGWRTRTSGQIRGHIRLNRCEIR